MNSGSMYLLRGMGTLIGEVTVKIVCLPSGKGVHSGSKFFPFRIVPLSGDSAYMTANRKSPKLSPLCKKMRENLPSESSPTYVNF